MMMKKKMIYNLIGAQDKTPPSPDLDTYRFRLVTRSFSSCIWINRFSLRTNDVTHFKVLNLRLERPCLVTPTQFKCGDCVRV